MTKILGIDLGTNSIGWAIVTKEKNENEFTFVDKGVRIFSEGVNLEPKKNSESSKAAKRTEYRSARKLKYRRKLRKIKLLKILSDNNLCPKLTDEELNLWRYKKSYPKNDAFRLWLLTDSQNDEIERKNKIKNPYYFRFLAATQKLNLIKTQDKHRLGRALYHMAQRRGFRSNRLDTTDNSIVEEKTTEIEEIILHASSSSEFIGMYEDFLSSYDSTDSESKALFKLRNAFKYLIREDISLDYVILKEKLIERLNRKEFLGKVKSAINDLSVRIENENCATLGAYFYGLHKNGLRIRNEYTDREEHYLHEFHVICDTQNIPTQLKKEIEKAIFYQRPLKSQKGLVAKCPLENNKTRIPISHPDFELFRMYSFLNTVKIKFNNDDKLRFLTDEEKEKIAPLFYRKSKPNFDFLEIAKKLTSKNETSGYYKDKNEKDLDVLFNYRFKTNVTGCPTIANLRFVFGTNWKTYLIQNFNKKNKDGSTKTEHEIIDATWHVLFRFDKIERLKKFALDYLDCEEKVAINFSKIKLKQNYGSLSKKAIRNILPYLEKGLIYSHAVFLANIKNILPKEIWENEDNRRIIDEEVFRIIDTYKVYINKINIVNELIHTIKEKGETWNSKNKYVVKAYQKDLLHKCIFYYGETRWASLTENLQSDLFSDLFKLFSTQMELNFGRGEFLKKETLDERVKSFLMDNFIIDKEKLKQLYHPSAMEAYKKAKRSKEDGKLYLGSPLISSIKNPMAMRALHQLKKVINQLIKDDAIDENTIVKIEMARELKSANERNAIRQYQSDIQTKRKTYVDEIKKLYKEQCNLEIEPTKEEILKYQLWIEQNRCCIYTGKTIGICDFIGANPKFDIEHTIPRSKSLDNSQVNKTLCCSKYNRDTKKDKIPSELDNHEDFLLNLKHWYARLKTLENKIKSLSKKVRVAADKENKDKYIQERIKLNFEYKYYKRKYATFTIKEIPNSFKNSQGVDIGIISKYGNLFLKSLFNKVYTVKGKTTSNLRDIWGLNKKERNNHAHHAKDAVVVACCSRDINEALADYFHKYDDYKYYGKAKPSFVHRTPWKGFHKDVDEFDINTLISHQSSDILSIQSKKAIRKRGIIQRNKKGEIKYQQGDTVRGALHKDSFYGAIKRVETDKQGNSNEVVRYVLRKPLDQFKSTDIKQIVDSTIRDIVSKGKEEETKIKKEIEHLNKKLSSATDAEKVEIKNQIAALLAFIKNELYVLPNKNGKPIPIKKIRYFTPDVKKPLEIKKHRDVSKHEHKQHYFAKNDSNYCYAFYEGKSRNGKILKNYKVVNYYEAGDYFTSDKAKNKIPVEENILDKNNNILQLKFVLKMGTLVLFYEHNKNELKYLSNLELSKRLYKTVGIESDGRVQFRLHNVSKPENEMIKSSVVDFINPHEKLRISKSNLKIMLNGTDFKLSELGKISFL